MATIPGLKVTRIKTKTFVEPTAAALDTAIATFIATLNQETFLDLQFTATHDPGGPADLICAQLTYTA